jgi:Protein of unknown function (DUF551)
MSDWISVKDRLPEHHKTVLVCNNKKGMCVVVFIDSIEMNKVMEKSQYPWECVDVKKHPYYFISQEINQHTANNITHWMPLPEPPKDE